MTIHFEALPPTEDEHYAALLARLESIDDAFCRALADMLRDIPGAVGCGMSEFIDRSIAAAELRSAKT